MLSLNLSLGLCGLPLHGRRGGIFTYLQPDGVGLYFQPDGVSQYFQP